MTTQQWRFKDPPNVAVIANRRIIFDGDWIAYVSHNSDDGARQFHTSQLEPVSECDAVLVSLQSIVKLDSTVLALADLPPGWHAWRDSKWAAWQRAQQTD